MAQLALFLFKLVLKELQQVFLLSTIACVGRSRSHFILTNVGFSVDITLAVSLVVFDFRVELFDDFLAEVGAFGELGLYLLMDLYVTL